MAPLLLFLQPCSCPYFFSARAMAAMSPTPFSTILGR